MSSPLPYLLGFKESSDIEIEPGIRPPAGISEMFAEGGFFVAKNDRNYLFADYGEVGLKGRGGHGHNDLFSFELCLDQIPVVIDPGTPTYTGDLDTHVQYRSTSFHNTVRVDGVEMADFLSQWRISDEADPNNVEHYSEGAYEVIHGEHR